MVNREYGSREKRVDIPEESTSEKRLLSSEGDETLSQARHFLHGAASMIDARGIEEAGLRCREGRATLSTDLAHSLAWAMGEKRQYSESQTARGEDEDGRVFIFRKPDDLRVDYGLFTDAVVTKDRVTGFPIKYASGRKQLALYRSGSTKDQLQRLKKEERDTVTLSPDNIEAVIRPSVEIRQLVAELCQRAKRFEKIDIDEYATRLTELLQNDDTNSLKGDVLAMSRDIITTTIESVTISKIRNLSLDILAAKGHVIIENNEPQPRQKDAQSVRAEVLVLYEQCHQNNFDIGIEWLNTFIVTQSKHLRDEMN